MIPTRPDLTDINSAVRAYIEALEAELTALRGKERRLSRSVVVHEDDRLESLPEINEPTEPPTTYNIITAAASALAKRTPRHLYTRQRRGGMGVFDLETPDDEPPVALAHADEKQNLLLLTRMGRAYRTTVATIVETPVRGRGQFFLGKLSLQDDDQLAVILPEQAQGYLAIASQNGMVRMLRHHVFGEYMKPGQAVYDYRAFGPLAAACWTGGDGELFLATRQGRGIRFAEKLIPPAGGPGIRLSDGDAVVGIAPVYDDTGVFLLAADGRGTIRLMNSFTANKSPGAGGKIAMNTDKLVAALTTDEKEDALVISRLGKIIRFPLADIPPKDSPVQGVNCMMLRADEPVAAVLVP